MDMKKLTKVELIALIKAKDAQIAKLVDELTVLKAPKCERPYMMPREVVQAYFKAHSNQRSVDPHVLRAWAVSEGLIH